MSNPYEHGSSTQQSPSQTQAFRPQTQIAIITTSIVSVVLFEYIQLLHVPSGQAIPIWPVLLVPFVLSIISAVRSQSVAFPPLTAFLGIMSVVPVFAAFRGFHAAQPQIVFYLAMILATPGYLVARASRLRILEAD